MEVGIRCIKYLLFIFNLLFAASGVALIATGAIVQGFYWRYLDFLGNEFMSAPMLFIIVGVVIFVVAFFGCCGAIRENYCMVITFSVLIGLIFVCELAGGIAAYVLRGDVKTILTDKMHASLVRYNETDHGGVTRTWDVIQHDIKCCGVSNYTDWFTTPYGKGSRVPDSCCRKDSEGCGANLGPEPSLVIFTNGCLDQIASKIEDNAGIFAGVGIGIAFVQLIGMIFACLLARSINTYSPV